MSKLSGKYLASDLITLDLKGSDPLIEEVLFERDNTILLGKEKAGKSIFAMQMACALTSGATFLNQYKCTSSYDVVYIQSEGKLSGTRDNLKNMTRTVDCDFSRLLYLYYPSISLDTQQGFNEIIAQVSSWRRPEVIFIDPLYMSMAGDLKDDVASRKMVENLRILSETYQATIVLVHHAHRTIRMKDKSIVDEGDDSIFGSFVWKAYPDNIILIEKVSGNRYQRKISCATQRSGKVLEGVDITLIEPTPLYFKIKDDSKPIDDLVLTNTTNESKTADQIRRIIDRSYRHTMEAYHRLESIGKVTRVNPHKNPALFKLT